MLIRHSAVEHRRVYKVENHRETVGMIGEVDDMVRENLCLWSVSGAAKNETTWMTIVLGTQRCAILSRAALEPRVFA